MKWTDAIALNENWLFKVGDLTCAELTDFDDSSFTPVTLPHDWQIKNTRDPNMDMGWSQGYYPRAEIGWYRLHFSRPEMSCGKTVHLLIDGCQRFYDVYLNGERVGGHRFGYVPCLLDITGKLKDENVLSVRVNNADTKGDRWYSGAGLNRGVRLLIDDPIHIAPWSIFTTYELDGSTASVHTKLAFENTLKNNTEASVTLTVSDSIGKSVYNEVSSVTLPLGKTEFTFDYKIENIELWDIDDPKLYTLGAEVSFEQYHDSVTETLGFRTFSFDGDVGFTLNGRIRKLYGADLHHDGGIVFGAAVPRAIIRRRLEALKKIGCNSIRCSHNPHDEALYELCDEMGLVMIDEVYDKWNRSELYFEKLHVEDWQEDVSLMVHRDRNHPSIVLWSMGNELEVQWSEYFFEHFPEMREYTLSLDPTRPVTVALIGFCGGGYFGDEAPVERKVAVACRYGEMVDVFCGNYMENYYTALREAGMNKAIIGTEVFSYYRHSELSATGVIPSSPWRDVDERPYVAGGYVWAGVDYLGESTGYPCKGWTGCPIDSTGIPKLRASHLEAQWSDKPMIRVGVYDGRVPYDGASSMWGFPQISDHWNHHIGGDRIIHTVVMSNCEEVRLYQNDEPVRISHELADDRMFHFYVRYREGTLRAVGLIGGEVAAEQILKTSRGPSSLELRTSQLNADDDGIGVTEAWLLDEHGQPWTFDNDHEVRFTVSGPLEMLGIDNGNFMDEFDPHSDRCRFNNGHAVVYYKLCGKSAEIKAYSNGMEASLAITR